MLKYWFEFKDNDYQQHRVEIEDTAYSGVAKEVRGLTTPILRSQESISRRNDPVRGAGVEISFFAKGDEQEFWSFFTSNWERYKVKHTRDGHIEGLYLLTPELYEEDFSRSTSQGLEIGLVGNDGLASLKNYNYLNGGNMIVGHDSLLTVLLRCFRFIPLAYRQLYVSSSLQTTGEQTEYWENAYVNNGNFYDENNKPQTAREVIDTILLASGCYVVTHSDGIYIVDLASIGNGIVDFMVYNIKEGKYVGAQTKQRPLEIIQNGPNRNPIMGAGQTLTMLPAINQQEIVFDSFYNHDPLRAPISDPSFFINVKKFNPSWQSPDGKYKGYAAESHKNYYLINGAKAMRLYPSDVDGEYVLQLDLPSEQVLVAKTHLRQPHIVGLTSIKLDFDYCVGVDYERKYRVHNDRKAYRVEFTMEISIGNLWYFEGKWHGTRQYHKVTVKADDGDYLNDKWSKNKPVEEIVVPEGVRGELKLQIHAGGLRCLSHGNRWTSTLAKYLRFKNISFKLVSLSNQSLVSAVQVNPNALNEGKKIDLNIGTAKFGNNLNQLGLLLQFRRGQLGIFEQAEVLSNITKNKSVQDHILALIMGNEREPSVAIKSLTLKNWFRVYETIKYKHLGNRILMPTAYTIDYRQTIIDIDLIEIKPPINF